MNFDGYTIRLTKREDAKNVEKILKPKFPNLENLFGKIDISKICEVSLYSLVAFSSDNHLVGFAAFDDNPMATLPPGFPQELSDKAGRWAVQAALDLGYRREMLLWITFCANTTGGEEEQLIHKALLSAILVLSVDTMVILQTSAYESGCIPRLLKPLAHYQKQDFKLSICSCRRSVIFPKLVMRRAREEDQDDLAPVIERAQQRGLPLTQIPESACPSEPYAMARLIASQTKLNSVFVAEVENRIMGVIALTSDVHLPSLHANYDIECFEGLASKTTERKLTTIIEEKEVDKFFVDPLASTSNEVQEEETKPQEPPPPKVEIIISWPENIFRITMLCMEEEYESRAIDIIDFSLRKLNKEFCLMTLPYVSPYHPLLHFFYRVPTRFNAHNKDIELSADKRCLYLLHVDVLTSGFAVRPFKAIDKHSLEDLLDNFSDKESIMDVVLHPLEGRLNMVAVLSNHVVGFAILDDTAPVEELSSYFDLQSLIDFQHHPFQNHASIVLFILNPIYKYRSRLFLQEIMRQTSKSTIYCPVFPIQELPDILDDLILVSGRQHAHMSSVCDWGRTPVPKEIKDPIAKCVPLERISNNDRSNDSVNIGLGHKPNVVNIESNSVGGPKEFVNVEIGEKGVFPKDLKMEEKILAAIHGGKSVLDKDTNKDVPKMSASTNTTKVYEVFRKDLNASTRGDLGKDVEPNTHNVTKGGLEGSQARETSERKSVSHKIQTKPPISGEAHLAHATKYGGQEASQSGLDVNKSTKASEKQSVSKENQKLKDVNNNNGVMMNVDLGKSNILDISSDGRHERGEVVQDEKNQTTNIAKFSKSESKVPPLSHPIRRGYYHGFDCALYVLSRKYLYRYKTVINARIVIVGSSITTAGFLHKLLASHELQFANLIMVSSVGFDVLSSTSLSPLIVDLGPKHSFPKLGLDCQVKIIKATAVGIDRKLQTIRLSNGDALAYDWLILSTGLQDQTIQKLGFSSNQLRGVVTANELILNVHEIVKELTTSADEKGFFSPIVVYGATLEAYVAIQALLQEGLEGNNMLLIHPETTNFESTSSRYFGDRDTSEMILASLIQVGLPIHSGMQLSGVEMNPTSNYIQSLQFKDLVDEEALDGMSMVPTSLEQFARISLKPVEELEDMFIKESCPIHIGNMMKQTSYKVFDRAKDEDKVPRPKRHLKQPCSLLVTCDKRQVDVALFQTLNEEALIFDGRIVVDGYFQTNDPRIFAAGNLCKFSRHCGDNLPKLETFCPWEVGEALAPAFKAVVITTIYGSRTRFASQEEVTILKQQKWPRPNLPTLQKARCIGGYLSGELWFLSATAPKFSTPIAGEPMMSLMTRTPRAYCRLDIMDNREVGRFIYFGKYRLEEWKVNCFVGLPETILNDLVKRWENKQVPDIADFLMEPWSAIILHDKFPRFFQKVSTIVKEIMQRSKRSMTVFVAELQGPGKIKSLEPELMKQSGDKVLKKLMRFLKDNEREVPNYTLPWKLEDEVDCKE